MDAVLFVKKMHFFPEMPLAANGSGRTAGAEGCCQAGFRLAQYDKVKGEVTRVKILIVEDERLLAESIGALLENQGFEVEMAFDGETGMGYAELGVYDLLILDVMMPGLDGYEVARRVRERRLGVPILMLTARCGLEDRIQGLNAGADYYLTKPFDVRELLACIHALLRRQGPQVDQMELGNTTLDLSSALLQCGSKRVRLSAKEFEVMRFLF